MPTPYTNPVVRFYRKVSKQPDGCWLWTAGLTGKGYGNFYVNGKTLLAHRFAWFLEYGSYPPDNLFLLHSCDDPKCVNPAHLRPGTQLDNRRDCVSRNRQAKGVATRHANKLTAEQVKEIKVILAQPAPPSFRALGRRFGVGHHAISAIQSGRYWSDVHVS